MVERNLTIGTILVAAALTATIMGGIFYFGGALRDTQVQEMMDELERLEVERRSQDVSRDIAGRLPKDDCEVMDASIGWAVRNLGELEERIEQHEEGARMEGEGFRMLKKEYTNFLLEYWLLTKEAEEECDINTTRILYFYADDATCPRCTYQGTILTHYRQEYEEDILVFPLDVTLDMEPVDLLIDAYVLDEEGETTYPTMKINGEVYRGFVDMEEMGEILEEEIEEVQE